MTLDPEIRERTRGELRRAFLAAAAPAEKDAAGAKAKDSFFGERSEKEGEKAPRREK